MGDGFYRSKDPTNSIKVLKEHVHSHTNTQTNKTAITDKPRDASVMVYI